MATIKRQLTFAEINGAIGRYVLSTTSPEKLEAAIPGVTSQEMILSTQVLYNSTGARVEIGPRSELCLEGTIDLGDSPEARALREKGITDC